MHEDRRLSTRLCPTRHGLTRRKAGRKLSLARLAVLLVTAGIAILPVYGEEEAAFGIPIYPDALPADVLFKVRPADPGSTDESPLLQQQFFISSSSFEAVLDYYDRVFSSGIQAGTVRRQDEGRAQFRSPGTLLLSKKGDGGSAELRCVRYRLKPDAGGAVVDLLLSSPFLRPGGKTPDPRVLLVVTLKQR